MALKSDDILLVQRGDQSYQMPASQLGSADFVGGDLQAVTDKGNTTTNYLDIGTTTLENASIFASNNHTNPTVYARNYLATGSTFKGLNAAGNFTIDLKANGSAIYDSTSAGASSNGITAIIDNSLNSTAAPFNARNDDSNGYNFIGVNGGNSNQFTFCVLADGELQLGTNLNPTVGDAGRTIQLKGEDGTAEFADKVTTGDNNTRGQFRGTCPSSVTASSADAFVATHDGNIAFNVKYDGSGLFGGAVTTNGGWDSAPVGSQNGVITTISNSSTSGYIAAIAARNLQGGGRVWAGANTAGQVTSEINETGAAKFASGNDVFDASGKLTIKRTDGDTNAVLVLTTGSDSAHTLFYGNGTATFVNTDIQFMTGGSATFASDVEVRKLLANSYILGGNSNTDLQFYGADNSTKGMKLNFDGSLTVDGRVDGTVETIANNTTWDMKQSNYWTTPGPTLGSPTNATAGQTGVIYCSGEVNAFGNLFSFPGGSTPTIPANSIVPYYVDTTDKVRLGLATEAFV